MFSKGFKVPTEWEYTPGINFSEMYQPKFTLNLSRIPYPARP